MMLKWSEPKKKTNENLSGKTKERIIMNKMNDGEVRRVKVTVKGIYTFDNQGNQYVDSRKNPYLKSFLVIEDLSNGDKDSFYETVWSNKISKFIASLGYKPKNEGEESAIPDITIFSQEGYNNCYALIEKASYVDKQTGKNMPCLRVKEWLQAEGELKDVPEPSGGSTCTDENDIPF